MNDDENPVLINQQEFEQEIGNLITTDILDEIATTGMALEFGANPPAMDTTFTASPFEGKASTYRASNVRFIFNDYSKIYCYLRTVNKYSILFIGGLSLTL